MNFYRQEWLKTTGSPRSRIDRVLFSDFEEIADFTFDTFQIFRQAPTAQ